jgi:hypothetical protein
MTRVASVSGGKRVDHGGGRAQRSSPGFVVGSPWLDEASGFRHDAYSLPAPSRAGHDAKGCATLAKRSRRKITGIGREHGKGEALGPAQESMATSEPAGWAPPVPLLPRTAPRRFLA